MNNSYLILKRILHLLDVPFTNGYLKEKVETHPEPDSLLCLSDILTHYRVNSLGVQLTEDKLEQIPLPCIAQLQDNGLPYFSMVSSITDESVIYMDEKGKNKNISKEEFAKQWKGITLLLEKTDKVGEPGYTARRKEVFIFRALLLFLGLISIIGLVGIYQSILEDLSYSNAVLSLISLKATGLVISSILLWSEVNKNNLAIKDFCTGGKNVDCNSVVSSFYLPGGISLSNIAFSYFLSGFLLVLLTSFSGSGLRLLGYLSLAGIVIVPLSIYYQWAKIKNWCILCLGISAVLVFEILVSQLLLVTFGPISLQDLILFAVLFMGSVLVWHKLKPFFLAKKELHKQKRKLSRFMSNPEVFEHLLSGSRRLSNNPEGLGIMQKGERTKYHVIKVCNPYCGPCAKTHPLLEELFEAGNIDLQVIFHPGGDDEDKRKTINHIMAATANTNQEETKKALDDWYLLKEREYDAYAAKYPLNVELKAQEAKIQSMLSWCEMENITYTPTIFINGYELPKAYAVEDLKYILY